MVNTSFKLFMQMSLSNTKIAIDNNFPGLEGYLREQTFNRRKKMNKFVKILGENMMTLDDFINEYDKIDSIVLLEGKRDVDESDREKLTKLARILTKRTKNILFRSGNADGSDYLFSIGVSDIDKTKLQVIIPYSGHRKKANKAYDTISLDDINITAEPDVVNQSKQNKKVVRLIEQYASGVRNRNSIKAAYIIRDTIKAIGTTEIKPATFGLFYDDLSKPREGGTGHTMAICEQNNIPIIDQQTWFEWLNES